jgi:squalene synthase HpnC
MGADSETKPSKTHRDENFPVASILIAKEHRATILAYYRFARGADDIVDNAAREPDDKHAGLDLYEATLLGKSDAVEAALPLRAVLAETKLSPRHALDLLHAFRMDAVKKRYADWGELMHYCAFSAAPVGRFVLDVHGESEATWPASDAICSALQVINHLQDCAADYRNFDRVYIPLDSMARESIEPEALSAARASPGLRACLKGLAEQTGVLIDQGVDLPRQVQDLRLCLETSVIVRLAQVLNRRLLDRDPLSEPVHLTKPGFLAWSLVGICNGLINRTRRSRPVLAQKSGGT